MAKEEQWQPCPRCGSTRVEKVSMWIFLLSGLGLSGCSIWLLFIPVIGIVGIIVGLIMFVLGLVGVVTEHWLPTTLQCKDCKKTWTFNPNLSIGKGEDS